LNLVNLINHFDKLLDVVEMMSRESFIGNDCQDSVGVHYPADGNRLGVIGISRMKICITINFGTGGNIHVAASN